jgi:hypothetical protein
MLQRLLALDPNCMSLEFWKTCHLVPSSQVQPPESDPRYADAQRFIRWVHRRAPHYRAIHPMHPTYPEECTLLLMNTFMCGAFRLYGPVERYSQWLGSMSKKPVYQDYRQQLQLLQYHDPRTRWVLKAPVHKNNLDVLLAVFPDACIVQTHRDPVKVISSACSHIATLRGAFSDRVDPVRIGQQMLHGQSTEIARFVQQRDAEDPAQFLDIHFNQLMQDPVGAVRRICEYFHYPYTEVFEHRMRMWLAENRRDKYGRHRFRLEQFGLDARQVREAFADYYRRYSIQPDGAPSVDAKAA